MSVEEFLGDDQLAEKSTARRDFLKFLGFSVAAATVAACEAPVTKVVPYVNKPEDVTPGMPTWYASTYYDGNSYASILVKTREARPIYIKGNRDFGITKGGTNPQIIASVLGLYDSSRLQKSTISKVSKSWSSVDSSVSAALGSSKKSVLLTGTVISPSLKLAITALSEKLGEGKFEHIQYDAVSYRAMRMANLDNFGQAIIPSYDFSKAKTIVSVAADFLGTWLMANLYQTQYGSTRNPDNKWMSKHFQFESVMTVTGSNADYRGMAKPSELAGILAFLINGLGGNAGIPVAVPAGAKLAAEEALKSLKKSGKYSLVVCGSNNVGLQILTNKLNDRLKSYGNTIDLKRYFCMNGSEWTMQSMNRCKLESSGNETKIELAMTSTSSSMCLNPQLTVISLYSHRFRE
jgi:molybdopterin-containing oxidoreductase family iron-sulfur binding subunit